MTRPCIHPLRLYKDALGRSNLCIFLPGVARHLKDYGDEYSQYYDQDNTMRSAGFASHRIIPFLTIHMPFLFFYHIKHSFDCIVKSACLTEFRITAKQWQTVCIYCIILMYP